MRPKVPFLSGSRCPIAGTRCPIFGTRYPISNTRYPIRAPETSCPIPAISRYPIEQPIHPIPDTRCPGLVVTQEVFVDVTLHVYTPEGVKAPSKGKGKGNTGKGERGADGRSGGGSSGGPAYIFNRALPPVRRCTVVLLYSYS